MCFLGTFLCNQVNPIEIGNLFFQGDLAKTVSLTWIYDAQTPNYLKCSLVPDRWIIAHISIFNKWYRKVWFGSFDCLFEKQLSHSKPLWVGLTDCAKLCQEILSMVTVNSLITAYDVFNFAIL